MAEPEIKTSSEFELDGFWWEPTKGRAGVEEVQGRLHYTPATGATLTVVDWHPNADFFDRPERKPVIHGKTLAGEPCSLFDSISKDWVGYGMVDGHSREEWNSNQLIYGAHVDDPDEFEVQRVRVKLRGLREWLCEPWHGLGEGRPGLGIEPGFVEVRLDEATLTLGLRQLRSNRPYVQRHEIQAAALFEFDQPIKLAEFKDRYSGPLHDFILLATHEETRIESITSLVVEETEKWWGPEEDRKIEHERGIEIIERTNIQPLRARKNPYRHLLLPWAVWGKDGAAEPLQRWFAVRAELAGLGDLLVSTLNVRFIYLENQLLNLMSFTEAYHRTLHDEPLIDADTHAESVKTMLGALADKRLRELYGMRLQHAYEQTQARRLRALFERAEGSVEDVKAWRERLVRRLVATRNYLTHWSEWSDEVLADRDRWLATVRLQIVIEINLMLDIGMQPATIRACVHNAYPGHYALREPV